MSAFISQRARERATSEENFFYGDRTMTTTNSLIAQTLIQSCIDTNSSWAQGISELGLIASLDWDLCLDGSTYAWFLTDELGISEEEAIAELTQFIRENRLWTPENVLSYMSDVIRLCLENGDVEETTTAISNYAEHYERPDILEAFKEAAAENEYAEEFAEALAEI